MSEKKVFRLSLDVIWIRIIAESVHDYIQINLPIGLNTLEWNLMERKQRPTEVFSAESKLRDSSIS